MQLVIFDLDGVIVDTAKYHYLAWKRLADQLLIPFTEQENERLKGVSRMRSLQIILELGGFKLNKDEQEKLAAQKNDWYIEYIGQMDSDEILPGVIPFLAILREEGIKTSLVSASKNARFILDRLSLDDKFDAIVDGNSVSKAKPDPEGFLLAAAALHIEPTRAVVFEDAAAGIEAAKRAGMLAIGIGQPNILKGADLVLPGFGGIERRELLGRLRHMISCRRGNHRAFSLRNR